MKTSIALSLAVLCSCGPMIASEAELEGLGMVVEESTAIEPEPIVAPPADAGPGVDADAGIEADAGTVSMLPDAGPPDAGPPLTGLPCNVRTVLVSYCSGCH